MTDDVQCPLPDWSLGPEVSKHERPAVSKSYGNHPTVLLQEKAPMNKISMCNVQWNTFLHNSVRGDTLPVLQAEAAITQMSSSHAYRKATTADVNHLAFRCKMEKLIFCIISLIIQRKGGDQAHLLVVLHSDFSIILPGYVQRHRPPSRAGEVSIGNS